MRLKALVLALLLLSLVPAQAEEEPLPIAVAPLHGIDVTEAQLDWIRAWLKQHLHPVDLAVLEVDVDNRVHPGSLVCAEARLPAKEVDTYHVRRVIRIGHESWDVFGDAYGFAGAEKTGPWRVVDTFRVERVFALGKTRKILPLVDDLSYAEVRALLVAIEAKAVRAGPEAAGGELPNLQRISWISREDDQYHVMMTDPDDDLQGTWCKGTMEDGTFVVSASGMWIS